VADSTEQALSRLRPKLTGNAADRLQPYGITG
jgi:hypothetical protein